MSRSTPNMGGCCCRHGCDVIVCAMKSLVVAVSLSLVLLQRPQDVDAAAANKMDRSLFSDVVTYDNHKVLRVIPTTQTQVSTLGQLIEGGGLDVWSKSRELNSPWDIMVSPLSAVDVKKTLEDNQLKWKVLIPDVERFQHLKPNALTDSSLIGDKKGHSEVSSRSASENTGSPRYLRYKEVNDYMDDLAKRFPNMVSVKSIGKSSEGRDLRIIHISTGKKQSQQQHQQAVDKEDEKEKEEGEDKPLPKPAVWIDAGIHAREWIAPATAIYIIHQLVENQTHTANLTRDVDWYILPLMNPDGYEFSHTNDRLWRKTRSKSWWGLGCTGADANRNFDFHWREVGASWSACSFTYAGSKAFSEPEARAVRDFLLANKGQIKMYLTYHSYGNFLLYPWGYTSTLPDDWKTLDSLAKKANSAMVAAGSEPYTIGSSTNVLYAAAGGSDDWAKGVAGIQLSYTIELPGGNGHGFDLPASYIPEIGRHQMRLIDVFGKYVGSME